jgi:hypothetical protein
VSSIEDLVFEHTGTDLKGGALVDLAGPVLVLNLGHVVGADRQSTGTRRTAEVTVEVISKDSMENG